MAIPARSDAVEQGRLRAAFPLSGDLLAIHVLFFEWLAEAGEQEPSECPVAQRGIGVDVPRLPRIGEAAAPELCKQPSPEIGRASCREIDGSTCRFRGSPLH